jgi:tetratricopeptide (TPR) repeat protein
LSATIADLRAGALGDIEGALADFDEAIRLNPDLAAAYHSRGAALAAKGDLERALADFEEAIRLKPDFANAYFGRARIRENDSENPDAAIADFEKYLELSDGEREEYRAQAEESIRDLKSKL